MPLIRGGILVNPDSRNDKTVDLCLTSRYRDMENDSTTVLTSPNGGATRIAIMRSVESGRVRTALHGGAWKALLASLSLSLLG